VRVDQEVGEGSGGTVIEGIREGCGAGGVSAGTAVEHPARSSNPSKNMAQTG
jgi:hypothetical protein